MHTNEPVLLPMRHEETVAYGGSLSDIAVPLLPMQPEDVVPVLGESLSFSAIQLPPVSLYLHSFTALNIVQGNMRDIVTPIPVVNGVINVDLDDIMRSLTDIQKPADLDPLRSHLFDIAAEYPQFQLVGTVDAELVGLPPPAWF